MIEDATSIQKNEGSYSEDSFTWETMLVLFCDGEQVEYVIKLDGVR